MVQNILSEINISWILLSASIFCAIVFLFICICWQSRKTQKYGMKSGNLSQGELLTNLDPRIIMDQKQNYFLHGVKYSSINNSDNYTYLVNTLFHLEDPQTENIHKNFDKSILRLEWSETPENKQIDVDETCSTISMNSKDTYFFSVAPHCDRAHSIDETFKSISSENSF